jgi:hypothetical protein
VIFKNTISKRDFVLVKSGLAFLMACMFVFANAQTISRAEYFFDTDPGQGNGTAITFAASDPVTITSSISTTGLKPGYHILYVRTRTSTGKWSLLEPQKILIDGGIIKGEYFFDTDPGIGNGTPLPITPFNNTISPTIPTTGLKDGVHYLFIRTRHDDKTWSLSDPQMFYIRTRIVLAEYFIDSDPGFGNGTPISISSPDDLITITPSLATPTLPDGDHYLFIRTKDILGKWSFFEPMMFTVDAALPIELFDFIAMATRDGRIKLQWTTTTEINNDFFSIERAVAPEIKFSKIFEVPGAGTTTAKTSYEQIDEKPYPGVNYYRLKQTDFDGKFSYSKVVSAEVQKVTSVYPNPITDKWSVEFEDAGTSPRVIEVLDLTGKKITEYKTQLTRIDLSREGIPAGTHILKIIAAGNKPEFLKVSFQ